MKVIALILSLLLLTSCSNPDTSGGMTLAKGGDDANEFPHGGCDGGHKNPATYDTGCGWKTINEKSYYIYGGNFNHADLTGANLRGANLGDAQLRFTNLKDVDLTGANLGMANMWGANLVGTNLTGANLSGAMLIDNNVWCETICPNGIHWGVKGHNCGEFLIGSKNRFGPVLNCACDPTLHC
jgi:hypothetical protein